MLYERCAAGSSTRTGRPARPTSASGCGSAAFKAAGARTLFESLELEEIRLAGRPSFVLAGDRSFPEPGRRVLLLEYDPYVMGFRERDELVPQPAGLWERRRRGKRLELDVQLARRVGTSEREELRREAERYGKFLALEPVLSVER